MPMTGMIVSKANSLRFAKIDGLSQTMDNTLSYDMKFINKPKSLGFKQVYFDGDNILVQVKLELNAALNIKQIFPTYTSEPSQESITYTTYTNFRIAEWAVSVAAGTCFYVELSIPGYDTWRSEHVEVIAPDWRYKLIQWTNFDIDTLNYEFDYNTALAGQYVNFIRIRLDDSEYKSSGKKTVYNNQNEKSVIKANSFGNIKIKTEPIPVGIVEKISIATDHDRFLINNVAYIAESKPNVRQLGSWYEVTIELTQNLSLGINTNDIGYDIETREAMNNYVINLTLEGVSGQQTLVASPAHAISRITVVATDTTVKIGSTVDGQDIVRPYTFSGANRFKVLSRDFIPLDGIENQWYIYIDIDGGTADIYIQTIKID